MINWICLVISGLSSLRKHSRISSIPCKNELNSGNNHFKIILETYISIYGKNYNEPHFRAVFNEGIQCAIIKKRNFRLVKSAFWRYRSPFTIFSDRIKWILGHPPVNQWLGILRDYFYDQDPLSIKVTHCKGN